MHRKANPLVAKGGRGGGWCTRGKKSVHTRDEFISSVFFSFSLRKSRSAAKFRGDFGPTRVDSLNFPYRHGCGEVDIAPAILHSEISGTKGIMTIRSPGITSECYLERDRREREREDRRIVFHTQISTGICTTSMKGGWERGVERGGERERRRREERNRDREPLYIINRHTFSQRNLNVTPR